MAGCFQLVSSIDIQVKNMFSDKIDWQEVDNAYRWRATLTL